MQYGAITIATNTVAVADACHSGTSDDFSSSIGVGLGTGGAEAIYLNWAYTGSPAGVATSDTVDSYVTTSGQVLNQIGTDVPVVHGDVTPVNSITFSFFSSVDVDPRVLDGSCAVAAQQFYTFGVCDTEISRIGNC